MTEYPHHHLRYEGMDDEATKAYPNRYVLGLGSYRGGPFVTRSSDPDNLKTDYHDIHASKWIEQPEYPFANENLLV